MVSFGTFAQSISTSTSTLDHAEVEIAVQTAEQGASYEVTSAQFNNRAHTTAELTKQNRHTTGPSEGTGDSDNTVR